MFKVLKEDVKKVLCRAGTPVESPSTPGNINTSGNDTSLQILDSEDERLVNVLKRKKTPKKLRGLMRS